MSSAERQRRFQAAHPGYDRRRKARQKARIDSAATAMRLPEEAMDVDAKPAEPVAVPAPLASAMMPVPAVARLALPAPVVHPVLAELNALRAALASAGARARAPQPVRAVPAAA
jgi:hypothetical protein